MVLLWSGFGTLVVALVVLSMVMMQGWIHAEDLDKVDAQSASPDPEQEAQAEIKPTAQVKYTWDSSSEKCTPYGLTETLEKEGVYSISYPYTGVEAVDAAITQTIRDIQADLMDMVFDGTGPIGVVQYQTHMAAGDIGSIFFVASVNKASGVDTRFYTLNFDYQTGRALHVENLFASGGLQKLATLVKEALEEAGPFEEGIHELGVAPTGANYQKLLLTEEGLKVFFPAGQVLDKSYGEVVITVPYVLLEGSLNVSLNEGTRSVDLTPESARPPEENPLLETVTDEPEPSPSDQPEEPTKKRVALTFDDGPHGENTNAILDVLEEYDVPATFFVVGNRIAGREDIIRRMEELGCEIGNHTFDHKDLSKCSDEEMQEQLEKTNEALQAIVGHGSKIVRPPYNGMNKNVLEKVGYPLILWSVDTRDWETKDSESTYQAATAIKNDGNIILMHDIQNSTPAAVKKIVPELLEKGFEFVTVSQLLEADGEAPEAGQTYRVGK